MCCDADERVNVEVAMRKKGVGWILCELAGGKETKTESDTMDNDNTAKIEVPQHWLLARLSNPSVSWMTFSQGGHLMSNEKL